MGSETFILCHELAEHHRQMTLLHTFFSGGQERKKAATKPREKALQGWEWISAEVAVEQLFGVGTKEEFGLKVKVCLVSHSICGEPCLKFLLAFSIPCKGTLNEQSKFLN